MERTRMSIRQPQQTRNAGRHAVVIGASMAGLLAGRVLSEHIERDRISRDTEARKGVPQARHVHVLLKKGASLLTEFFPDLSSTLVLSGAPYLDSIEDVRWYHYG